MGWMAGIADMITWPGWPDGLPFCYLLYLAGKARWLAHYATYCTVLTYLLYLLTLLMGLATNNVLNFLGGRIEQRNSRSS